ncbi:MAG: hypothetical protein GX366_07265 [Epulopiscium sp.]|nr:hypothetical protein [Candidatus Epulonipiscium sp.]
MRIKEFDTIKLKDGREGDVMEVLGGQDQFIVTVGDGPHDWEDIVISIDDIEKVIHSSKR